MLDASVLSHVLLAGMLTAMTLARFSNQQRKDGHQSRATDP